MVSIKVSGLEDVPLEYLEWCIRNSRQQIEDFETKIQRREQAEEASLSYVEQIVTIGYRELAKRNYPDFGGDTKTMQEINNAVEALRDTVRRNPSLKRTA